VSIDLAAVKAAVSLPELVGATLRLKRTGRLFLGCCPFHDEKTPSFYVYDDHFHCFGCGAHGDAIDFLMRTRNVSLPEAARLLLGQDGRTTAPRPAPVKEAPRPPDGDLAQRIALAKRIWAQAVDPRGSIVEAYLATRGLKLPRGAPIRFHPRCPFGGSVVPAMIAGLSDPGTGKAIGIHRTALRPDGSGKADIERPKRMLGTAGVVRLVPDNEAAAGLGLAEGIETGLAVLQRFGWSPVWAACSAGGIRNFPLLAGIESVAIFADGDAPGLDAARACADRWAAAGREATIVAAPAGTDWNDRAREIAA
jgi:putative DNA primase/helicase